MGDECKENGDGDDERLGVLNDYATSAATGLMAAFFFWETAMVSIRGLAGSTTSTLATELLLLNHTNITQMVSSIFPRNVRGIV